jgi:hypothetical protein
VARRNSKLTKIWSTPCWKLKNHFDEALAEIEKVQWSAIWRALQEPYNIDYNDLLHVVRLVRAGQLAEARVYLERWTRMWPWSTTSYAACRKFSRYQMVHADNKAAAQFPGRDVVRASITTPARPSFARYWAAMMKRRGR